MVGKLTVFLLIVAVLCSVTHAGIVYADDAGTDDIVLLGKKLFFDAKLSLPNGQSCASCHDPEAGFADPDTDKATSGGVIRNRFGSRNAPSAAYAAFSPALYYDPTPRPGIMEGMYVGGLFWDGRVDSLEEQAKEPFLNHLEMNNPCKTTVVLSVRRSDYADLFRSVFGPGSLINVQTAYEHIAEAIAAYERSDEINPFTSKYDYWKKGEAQFTESEMRGYMLFTDTTMMGAKCANCHSVSSDESLSPSLFTNFGYQNLGTPRNPDNPYYSVPTRFNPDGENYVDYGLGAVLGEPMENGKFKIPSLRNVALTAPYEHNGVFKTLREVVMFNNTRDVPEAGWPPPEVPENVHRHMPPMPRTFGQLGLTDQQVDDIVAFLETLTDGYIP